MSPASAVITEHPKDGFKAPAGDRPFWVKCSSAECGHCWAAAYFPMDAELFTRIALGATKHCPKCGAKKPFVAKQDNGVLLEPHGNAS